MKWEYKGQRLAPPLTILRRLVAFPILWIGERLCFIAVFAGYGREDAKYWRDFL